MNIVIRKVAMRGSLFLDYEFEQKDVDVNNTIKTKSDAPIHDDLRNAFRALIPHFAFITEEVLDEDLVQNAIERPESYLEDREHSASEVFFKFLVHDVTIDSKKGCNYLTISGSKQLTTLDTIGFTAPSIDLDGTKYKFRSELSEAVEHLKEEVLAYMQGKQAPKTQMEMFGSDTETEEEENDNTSSTKAPKAKANATAALGD